MPQINCWKDIIDEDTTLIFDLDTPIHQAANLGERTEIKIIHKPTGKEVFKEKDKPVMKNKCSNPETLDISYEGKETPQWVSVDTGETANVRFKNKTEFWGRTKKVASGWLGDRNTERVAKKLEPFDKSEFEITTLQIKDNEGLPYYVLKNKIREICDYLGIHKKLMYVGRGETHRHKLDMPVKYKSGRGDAIRPLMLQDMREYAIKLGAKWVDNVEPDDVINFYAWESHIHYKATGKHKYIVITIDKDNYGFNGLYFNYYKDQGCHDWKHPYPILVNGLGYLKMEKGKCKGEGQLWALAQFLFGDSTDDFSPTKHAKISFADKAAYEYLATCTTVKQAFEKVVAKYYEWYPEGVKFKSWTGEEVELTTVEWMNRIWTMLYMMKSYDDDTTFTGICDRMGVKYNYETS